MGSFTLRRGGSARAPANERPHRTNPPTLQNGTHVTPALIIQPVTNCNTLLVYIDMLFVVVVVFFAALDLNVERAPTLPAGALKAKLS